MADFHGKAVWLDRHLHNRAHHRMIAHHVTNDRAFGDRRSHIKKTLQVVLTKRQRLFDIDRHPGMGANFKQFDPHLRRGRNDDTPGVRQIALKGRKIELPPAQKPAFRT